MFQKITRYLIQGSYHHITNKAVKEMDKTGNRTIQSPLNHCKKTAIELVWTRHPFIKISRKDGKIISVNGLARD